MGIDAHNLNFLAHAQDLGVSFERTVSLGRQAVFVDPPDLMRHQRWRRHPELPPSPAHGTAWYFEPLMRQWFAASQVDSIDASPYEQATLIHDMNQPWPAPLPPPAQYDAVLDLGCLEHVFDFPTAWRNCAALCRVGGHLLHALPANNLLGHGFYQFSPELFFNLYQPSRGFELRAMYCAMKAEPRHWWRVASPLALGRRVTLCHGHEVYLMVLARKTAEVEGLPAPQQSDYAQDRWQAADASVGPAPSMPHPLAAPLASMGLLGLARRWRHRWQALAGARLALPAPDFVRVDVAALLDRPGTVAR